MSEIKTIDAARLPEWVNDTRAPVWWGMTLLSFILATLTLMMLASYFFLAGNSIAWPPPQPAATPPLRRPLPDLLWSTIGLAVLLLSCIPTGLADRAAREMKQPALRINLSLTFLTILAAMAVRWQEFRKLHFAWNDNAYGSAIWGILSIHSVILYSAAVALTLLMGWSWWNRLDKKHAFDVTIAAQFWYWTVAMWIPSYLVLYWSPRLMV